MIVTLPCCAVPWHGPGRLQDLTLEQFVSFSWRLHEQMAARLAGGGGGALPGLLE